MVLESFRPARALCRAPRPARAGQASGAVAGAVAAALALAACVADSNGLRGVAVATGLSTRPTEPADFVKASRSETGEYLPIGAALPPRPSPIKPASEVKATERHLEATRAANEAAGARARSAGRTSPPKPAEPGAE